MRKPHLVAVLTSVPGRKLYHALPAYKSGTPRPGNLLDDSYEVFAHVNLWHHLTTFMPVYRYVIASSKLYATA
jgi:hypothetical protein